MTLVDPNPPLLSVCSRVAKFLEVEIDHPEPTAGRKLPLWGPRLQRDRRARSGKAGDPATMAQADQPDFPSEIGSIDAGRKHSILFFGHRRPQFLKPGEEQLENRRGVLPAVTD